MSPEATLKYIQQSLRMKMSKKIIRLVVAKEIKMLIEDSENILFLVEFNCEENGLSECLLEEIPLEGGVNMVYAVPSFASFENDSIIDVLIVDDIEFNVKVLRKVIESLSKNCSCKNYHKNYTIHSAQSGKNALELLCAQDALKGGYKLIFMDCLMPEMDGWETTLEVTKLYKSKKIHFLPYIIAYSAFDSKDDIEKSIKSGMNEHISKPCTREKLCKVLNQRIN